VDVPRCHSFKEERLLATPPRDAVSSCTRVIVEADLSEPSWTTRLCEAGFDPSAPAFFLAEGLLMYLPPDGVPAFFQSVSRLMCAGSLFTGCCFIDLISGCSEDQKLWSHYGTKFTFETQTEAELRSLLLTAGLSTQSVQTTGELQTDMFHSYRMQFQVPCAQMWKQEALLSFLQKKFASPRDVASILAHDVHGNTKDVGVYPWAASIFDLSFPVTVRATGVDGSEDRARRGYCHFVARLAPQP